jgi:hypothetical protein
MRKAFPHPLSVRAKVEHRQDIPEYGRQIVRRRIPVIRRHSNLTNFSVKDAGFPDACGNSARRGGTSLPYQAVLRRFWRYAVVAEIAQIVSFTDLSESA